MSNRNIIVRWSLVFLLVLSAGCVTHVQKTPEVTAVPSIKEFHPRWQPVFKGVALARGLELGSNPEAIYAARINLHTRGISFLVTPPKDEKSSETAGQKTSTFLKTNHCQVAVNATPFGPVAEVEGAPKHIEGLSESRGKVYSKSRKDRGALLISKDNKAVIAGPPVNLDDAFNAVGGYGMLIPKGRNVHPDKVRHPRTAFGLSKHKKYLYFLVIDGRQPGYSMGATLDETADWIRQLGAHTAINMDGGGSSCLVISDGHGGVQAVNRPIHDYIPGNERVNGNNLGVFARGLK